MATTRRIKFGDGLTVVDEGGGVIRVDASGVGSSGSSGDGGDGIKFDTFPQEGGSLVITTKSGNLDLVQEAPDSDLNIYTESAESGINIDSANGIGIVSRGDSGIIIKAQGEGNMQLRATGPGSAEIEIIVSGGRNLMISGLPTSDPGVGAAIWNDNGTLVFSGSTAGGGSGSGGFEWSDV